MAPFLDTVTPIKQNVSSVPENQMIYSACFGGEANPTVACSGKGNLQSVFAPGIKNYDKDTFVGFIEAFEELMINNADLQGSNLFLEHFSRVKALEYSDESSAYPWRDITAHPSVFQICHRLDLFLIHEFLSSLPPPPFPPPLSSIGLSPESG